MGVGFKDKSWPRQRKQHGKDWTSLIYDRVWSIGLKSGSGVSGVVRVQAEEVLQVKVLIL